MNHQLGGILKHFFGISYPYLGDMMKFDKLKLPEIYRPGPISNLLRGGIFMSPCMSFCFEGGVAMMGFCWGWLKGKGTLDDIIPVITIVEPCDRCFQGCLNYPDWLTMSWFVWGVWRVKLNLLAESSHDLDTWWITRGDHKSPNWAYSHSRLHMA